MKARNAIAEISFTLLGLTVAAVFLTPVAVIVINSLKTAADSATMTLAFPADPQWRNFAVVVERGKLATTFLNSLLYASVSSLVIVFFASAASFVLARRNDRVSNLMYYFMVLGTALPVNYIALMRVMKALHLINTAPGIILIYIAIGIPISLFISYGYISTIPRELDEAAVIDGCSPVQLFFTIIAPMMLPVAVTVFVLNFMSTWNDFIMPLYFLNATARWPMTLAVYNFFGMFQTSWNLVSADIVLTSLPVLLVFLFGQKYIVGGLTSGAIKG